jgi:hypothetical protein
VGSTYWRKKDSEKAELFKKVEPYLTYLSITELERKGADLQSKLEELAELNRNLYEKDKFKDDIITGLSDRLIELTERVNAIGIR